VTWLFVALSALVAFVVAAVAVGSVVARTTTKARPAVYDLDEAVEFVADRLPAEVTAQVSYDDVRQVLRWHLDLLAERGVATYRTDDEVNPSLVVVGDDEPIARILGRADEAGIELTDEQVVAILAAQERYYEAIGAIGPQVRGPADPDGL
jgi:hypothetical protein